MVAAALLAAAVKVVAAVVAPGWRGFWQVVAPTGTGYVNLARIIVLLGAPAAVTYRNDGWLPAVGVGTFAVYATVTGLGGSGPLGPGAGSPAVVAVVLSAVATGLWVGSLGYLLGTAARILVWVRGRVGTPG